MTYAERAVSDLNGIPSYAEDWWNDYVYPLVGYDAEATEAADTSGSSTIVVFEDGSACRFDDSVQPTGRWVVDGPPVVGEFRHT